jgi:polyhydroxyalkanoate synthesis regulator phasin
MPQSKSSKGKSSGGATRSRRAAASRSSSAAPSEQSLREQLQRFLDPREVVVVTVDRLQEALDEAVERGRITRDDASALLTDVLQRGRKQTDDLRDELEGFLTGARNKTSRSVSGSAERVLREVDRARRAAGVGPAFPILGYDDLTAAQVTERLGDLAPAELRKVRDYEKRNANRKSVLAAVEQKLK